VGQVVFGLGLALVVLLQELGLLLDLFGHHRDLRCLAGEVFQQLRSRLFVENDVIFLFTLLTRKGILLQFVDQRVVFRSNLVKAFNKVGQFV
jgi:hypothetical protein